MNLRLRLLLSVLASCAASALAAAPSSRTLVIRYHDGTKQTITLQQPSGSIAALEFPADPGSTGADAKNLPRSSADLRAMLLNTPYDWADNGTTLGRITFAPDGSARATWSGEIHYWRFESDGDLMISAMGTTYVIRLKYSPNDGRFSGARDRTSQVQDGVRTTLTPVGKRP